MYVWRRVHMYVRLRVHMYVWRRVHLYVWRRAHISIRNLSNGQRCGSLEFIGHPPITIEGRPRISIYFQSFRIQEVPLSRYWPFVGYANDFRHWITEISSPNNWFAVVVIYILSRHWPILATRRPMAAQYLTIFLKKMNDNARSNPWSSFIFLMTSQTIFLSYSIIISLFLFNVIWTY